MDDHNRMTFWSVSDDPNPSTGFSFGLPGESLVLDSWRHRQVANPGSSGFENGIGRTNEQVRTTAHDREGDSLVASMERNRGLVNGLTPRVPNANGRLMNLGDLQKPAAPNTASLSLDTNVNSVLQPQKSIAELSGRRRDAIRSAFHRVDTECQGFVTEQDLTAALQRFSQLNSVDQERLARSIAGNTPHRVPFAQFVSFYHFFGSSVERDHEFEGLIRHHWGFPAVSDLFDDMKNKFTMLGVAYAFRQAMEKGGTQELTRDAFQEALRLAGMNYTPNDVRRIFDSFDCNGGMAQNQTLEITKLAAHLTSAPRPQTPLPMLYGSAHFSEVGSEIGDLQNSLLSSTTPLSPSQTSGNLQSLKNDLINGKFPEPSPAPSEYPEVYEHANPNAPPPEAPAEDQEEGVLAPMEPIPNPNEPPPEAPEEEDEEGDPPDESLGKDADEDVQAPMEIGGAQDSSSKIGASLNHNTNLLGSAGQPTLSAASKPSAHLAAIEAAGNSATVGRQKAVTVGINYIGSQYELAGCINDSDTFVSLLTEEFCFRVEDIRQLRDDHPKRLPTRKNIAAALNWLLSDAQAGDHLFFHYSGHGSQENDVSGDEMDGKDETLVPCDFQQNGFLSDDALRRLLVLPLPKDARLTVILDCCHSGTAVDLPFKVKLNSDGKSLSMRRKPPHKMPGRSEGDVVLISGCKDTQTSADIGAGSAGNSKAAGAMTTAFKTVITKSATIAYFELITEMREFLKSRGFQQLPQLSSEHYLNLSECFMPEVEPPYEQPPPSLRPPVRKALTIGINYLTLWPGRGRLSGCINDSDTMVGILRDTYGFADNQICRLRDDRPDMMPTKANILMKLQWLTQGTSNGDELFFHFSGHGGQQKDTAHEEIDGKDETILPCDFETAGQITDDDLHGLVVDSLPKGARMWVIMDCCHSGTALDLRYKVTLSADGRTCSCSKTNTPQKEPRGEVIMISGCKDMQTSADVPAGSLGATKSCGAMTTAFRHAITQDITCEELLQSMRQFLKRNSFQQVPQMSSDQFVQLDTSFVQYQMRRKGKRELPPSLASRGLTSISPSSGMNGLSGVPQAGVGVQGVPGVTNSVGDMQDDFVLGSRINRLEMEIQRLRAQNAAGYNQGYNFNPGFSPVVPGMQPISPSGQFGVLLGTSMPPIGGR